MKKKEDNSYQLLFTALVLVVISIGGTLAWFASNSTSSVNQIGASLTRPTDNSGFDGAPLDYLANNGNFAEYGTEDQLTYVPGKNMLFRVQSTAGYNNTVVQIILDGTTKPILGDAIKIRFFNQYGGWETWDEDNNPQLSFPTPADDLPGDSDHFATINSRAQEGEHGWTVTSPIYPELPDSAHPLPVRGNWQVRDKNFLYFFLYMDPASGEEPANLEPNSSYEDYQGKSFSFKIKVTQS